MKQIEVETASWVKRADVEDFKRRSELWSTSCRHRSLKCFRTDLFIGDKGSHRLRLTMAISK